ncbi:MAG: NAD(P)/FAD-dependent oxidoreductase [Myxococcales bacterium]|nr:NAD(P)/FAD-dependent oxidoreductase [Myxococcales bacterium]
MNPAPLQTPPLDGRGPYDADVVVIGAGPAGLAAATRVRWVKGYHALAGSVCLVECGRPGGLLRWGSCVLTGPGWAFSGEKLGDQLMGDIERLAIPVVNGRAVALERRGPLLLTTLDDGRVLRSLAVIVATGLRPLANESELYLKGVRITFKGYEHFPALLRHSADDARGRGLVIIGNAKTVHLQALVEAHTGHAGPVHVITSERLIEVMTDDDGVTGVRLEPLEPGSGGRTLPCGAVFMDYNGFELQPDFRLAGLPLAQDERGFLRFDGWGRTSEEGVFAAGDIGGRYAATLPAFGDGVNAGLSAYAYAFERKLGLPPRLFAYAPLDEPLGIAPVDLPPLPGDAVPVALGRDGVAPPPDWVDGHSTLRVLAERLGRSHAELAAELARHVEERTLTVHRSPRS